jgi:hypothetical protein
VTQARECIARSWRSTVGPCEPSPDSSPRLAGQAAEREATALLRTYPIPGDTADHGVGRNNEAEATATGQEALIGENCRDRSIAPLTDRLSTWMCSPGAGPIGGRPPCGSERHRNSGAIGSAPARCLLDCSVEPIDEPARERNMILVLDPKPVRGVFLASRQARASARCPCTLAEWDIPGPNPRRRCFETTRLCALLRNGRSLAILPPYGAGRANGRSGCQPDRRWQPHSR